MAFTVTHRGYVYSGYAGAATLSTPAFTPAADALLVACIGTKVTNDSDLMSGFGTWELVATNNWSFSDNGRSYIYACLPGPTPSSDTADYTATDTVTLAPRSFSVVEIGGADVSGTATDAFGALAVDNEYLPEAPATYGITIPAFADANNLTLMMTGVLFNGAETWDGFKAGMVEIDIEDGSDQPAQASAYNPIEENTPTVTTSEGFSHSFIYGMEVLAEGAPALPATVLSVPTALNPISAGVTPQVTADEAGGNLYAYALAGAGQTPDHATIKANAQSTSTPAVGVNTMPDIGSLTPGTIYTLAFSAENTESTASIPVYVDFTTTALVANVVLRNLNDNSLFANQTGVEFAVWDEASLAGIGVPDSQGTGSTDAAGVLAIPYGTSIGANGIVLARKPVAGVDNTNDLWAAGGVLAE